MLSGHDHSSSFLVSYVSPNSSGSRNLFSFPMHLKLKWQPKSFLMLIKLKWQRCGELGNMRTHSLDVRTHGCAYSLSGCAYACCVRTGRLCARRGYKIQVLKLQSRWFVGNCFVDLSGHTINLIIGIPNSKILILIGWYKMGCLQKPLIITICPY